MGFIFDPICYSVPLYGWIKSIYILGHYCCISISYSLFISCFLVALCLHLYFCFVFLSAFVWWYSILFPFVSLSLLIYMSQFLCVVTIRFMKKKVSYIQQYFFFWMNISPSYFVISDFYLLPFYVFAVKNYPCFHYKFVGGLACSSVAFYSLFQLEWPLEYFLQLRSSGDKFPQVLYVWKSLYFSFIFKGQLSWI